MSEQRAEAVNTAAEAHNQARQGIVEVLNDPEAPRGALSSAAAQVEAARAEYDLAISEYEAEAKTLEAGL
jgi:outer membrane protein TolC